jgi:hypothetical protein
MKKISSPNFGGDENRPKLTRKGRKPRANFYQEPEDAPTFRLSAADWKEIERTYRNKVPDALRAEIVDIWDDYLWFSQCEKSKSYADEAIFCLERIASSPAPAEALSKTPRKFAHRTARHALIENFLSEELFVEAPPTPEQIASAASEFVDGIRAHDMAPKRNKPVEWDKMVVRLMIALRSHGLPYKVSKRIAKKGASPIVGLLHELHDRLPRDWRIHVDRDGDVYDETLAAAASNAWVAYNASPEGKRAQRELVKSEQATKDGREYKFIERHSRLNKALKYIAFRRHRKNSNLIVVEASAKTPS